MHPVVLAGLAAGTLDIIAAGTLTVWRGGATVRMLQGIAGGLIGPDLAFQGGAATAALGLGLHFFIAFTAAAVFYAASRQLPALLRHALIWGALYGVAVYFFMNRVVVPLSRLPPRPATTSVTMILIHILCVGLPIALLIRRGLPGLRASDPHTPEEDGHQW